MIGMIDMAWIYWPVLCVINVALAGLFAGMETGLYLVNRVRVELRTEAGSKRASTVHRFLRNMDDTLAMLLIGTNIHQYIAAFAVSAMFVLGGAGDRAEWYALAVTTPMMFVLAESLPKNLFQRAPEVLAYVFAWPLRIAQIIFQYTGLTPLVRLVSAGMLRLMGRRASASDPLGTAMLAEAFAEGHAAGALTGSQEEMAHRVMELADVHVTDIDQPMDTVVSVPVDISREEFLRRLADHEYSRIPVMDGETIVGILDAMSVLTDEEHRPPREWMAEPIFVAADETVTQALFHLRRARRHLVGVVDTEGRHIGILTTKDLVEAVVGDLVEW